MGNSKSTGAMKKRYRDLASKLADSGLILQGNISERVIKGKEGQKQKPGKTYGPYYQWTFKLEGKTVTVNLSKDQAKIYQKAIDNNRNLEDLLREMRLLAREILEAETEGVKKRKS